MKIHLVFGVITALLLVIVIGSRRQEVAFFDFDSVAMEAEKRAKEGFLSAVPALPKSLRDLSKEDYGKIKWKDDKTLWRKDGLPFQVRFVHPGYTYDRRVKIYVEENQRSEPVEVMYTPALFEFGDALASKKSSDVVPKKLPDWIGFAGFRLFHPFNTDVLDELAAFLGGSNFRAQARGIVYGMSSQAVLIEPEEGRDNAEVPVFTRFWLKRPDAFAKQFTLYALLESGSVTGAYQFDIKSEVETEIHVKAKLYFRREVEQVGYAPLISMFWFGENTSNTFGDFRPEVHKSDGLLLQRDNGEWLWRPLAWATRMQTNIFENSGQKGFGLFQRDRDFNHYQDLNAVFNKMPSVWVQPIKGFDAGDVVLIQQAAKSDDKDNVAAFWSPKTNPVPLQPVEIEYVMRWMTDSPDLPSLGRCESTRVDLQDESDKRQFFLDFAGGPLDRLKQGETPTAEVASPTGAIVTETDIKKNDFNKSWRVSFVVNANQKTKPTEVLCRLMLNGQPVSETWTYTWLP